MTLQLLVNLMLVYSSLKNKSYQNNHGRGLTDNDPGHLVDHSVLFRVERLLLMSFSRYLDVLNAVYVFEREPWALFK